MLRALLFFVMLASPAIGFMDVATGADGRLRFESRCEEMSEPVAVKYCIHKPPAAKASADLVYYLHGAGLSELAWQDQWYYTEQIREEWARTERALPTVVSVSFGPKWLLTANSSRSRGLLEVFAGIVMPKIESGLGKVGRRLAVGESMGGFNSIQLALRTDLFQKAAILCAPMSEVSPFASKAEIKAGIERSRAWQYYKEKAPKAVPQAVARIIKLTKEAFTTEEEWQAASPLALAEKVDPKQVPQMYVAVGFYDVFAAYEGNEIFAKRLEARGAPVDWRPQWGGHCAMDIPSLAKFLIE